jgi:hypothetical protein
VSSFAGGYAFERSKRSGRLCLRKPNSFGKVDWKAGDSLWPCYMRLHAPMAESTIIRGPVALKPFSHRQSRLSQQGLQQRQIGIKNGRYVALQTCHVWTAARLDRQRAVDTNLAVVEDLRNLELLGRGPISFDQVTAALVLNQYLFP